jgi:hypothetical protein
MPTLKHYGSHRLARQFTQLINDKYGTHHGARQDALAELDISRRLLNMYMTGQRAIPVKLWYDLQLKRGEINPLD